MESHELVEVETDTGWNWEPCEGLCPFRCWQSLGSCELDDKFDYWSPMVEDIDHTKGYSYQTRRHWEVDRNLVQIAVHSEAKKDREVRTAFDASASPCFVYSGTRLGWLSWATQSPWPIALAYVEWVWGFERTRSWAPPIAWPWLWYADLVVCRLCHLRTWLFRCRSHPHWTWDCHGRRPCPFPTRWACRSPLPSCWWAARLFWWDGGEHTRDDPQRWIRSCLLFSPGPDTSSIWDNRNGRRHPRAELPIHPIEFGAYMWGIVDRVGGRSVVDSRRADCPEKRSKSSPTRRDTRSIGDSLCDEGNLGLDRQSRLGCFLRT